ncbi:hypothetical protein [Methanopyrus sp.]
MVRERRPVPAGVQGFHQGASSRRATVLEFLEGMSDDHGRLERIREI